MHSWNSAIQSMSARTHARCSTTIHLLNGNYSNTKQDSSTCCFVCTVFSSRCCCHFQKGPKYQMANAHTHRVHSFENDYVNCTTLKWNVPAEAIRVWIASICFVQIVCLVEKWTYFPPILSFWFRSRYFLHFKHKFWLKYSSKSLETLCEHLGSTRCVCPPVVLLMQ